jgi:hypothetical protein
VKGTGQIQNPKFKFSCNGKELPSTYLNPEKSHQVLVAPNIHNFALPHTEVMSKFFHIVEFQIFQQALNHPNKRLGRNPEL